jgi:hypothetical protein
VKESSSSPGSTDETLVSAAVDSSFEYVHHQLFLLSQPARHVPFGDVPQLSVITRERD